MERVLLQNNSVSTATIGTVSYTGEQWRNGGNTTANVITFWYKTSSSTFSALDPTSDTGWTAVTALNFSSPINTSTGTGALDGNLTANKVSISANANISVPAGHFVMLRWRDPDHS